MKLSLVYLLILAFAFLEGHDPLLAVKQARVSDHTKYQFHNNTISGKTNKRSPVDLIASAACCDDDDDECETVKKKTGSTVSLLSNDAFEGSFVHSELKRTQHFSKHSDQSSQPVYIFQRELLI